MKLNLKEVMIDGRGSQSTPNTLFSLPSEVLGSFDLVFGTLFTYHEEPWSKTRTFEDQFKLLVEETSRFAKFEDRVQHILRMTTCWHEIRHFHDTFCTPAGYTIFKNGFLSEGLAGALAREIVTWRIRERRSIDLPLKRYFSDPELPDALKMIADLLRSEQRRFQLNVGNSPILEIEGFEHEADFYVVTLQNEFDRVCRIPCAYINVLRDDEPAHILWPIGFTLITETLSLLEQEKWIAVAGEDLRLACRELLKRGLTPYLPLLATYIRLVKRRGVQDVHDESLIGIATRALFCRDSYTYEQNPILACPWGWEFIRLLEDHFDVVDQEPMWSPPKLVAEHFREEPSPIPMPFLDHMRENYLHKALHEIDQVALDYASTAGYTYISTKFPRPPLVITHDGFKGINDPEFHEFWGSWVINLAITRNALYENEFTCPVWDTRTAWLFPRQSILPSGDVCRTNLKGNSCGSWNPGHEYLGPQCAWTYLLGDLFEPFKRRFADAGAP